MKRRRNGLIGLWAYGLIGLFFVSAAFGDGSGSVDYYSPENILKFADHLYQEEDYLKAAGEYQRYLFYSSQDADSIFYRLGLCYRRAGDMGRALGYFRKVTHDRFTFAASYQIAYSYFLSRRYENSIKFLNETLNKTEDADERGKLQTLSALNYLHQRRWHDAENALGTTNIKDEELSRMALVLKTSAGEGMTLPRKSPVLAGLLSAVVPGSGKFYCGQYGDGFYSFFFIVATGLLAWSGFQENGVNSIRGWIAGSACGIFYAGDVYGSAIAARIYNRQLETNLLKRLPSVPDD